MTLINLILQCPTTTISFVCLLLGSVATPSYLQRLLLLCAWESLLEGLGEHMGCQGLNPGRLCVGQTPAYCAIALVPDYYHFFLGATPSHGLADSWGSDPRGGIGTMAVPGWGKDLVV